MSTDHDAARAREIANSCYAEMKPLPVPPHGMTYSFKAGEDTILVSRKKLEAIIATALRSAPAEAMRAALEWYGEQARLARLIHSEGDAGRHALQADGGSRARAALAAAPSPWIATHRHVKRGTTYRVVGEAEAQVSKGQDGLFGFNKARTLEEGDHLTIYQGENGKLWARFPDEFNDGRFVPLLPAAGQSGE